jgi:hypothetical protein
MRPKTIKTLFAAVVVGVALLPFDRRAKAELILNDSFDYTVGTSLNGQSPDGGTRTWNFASASTNTASDYSIASGSLNVPANDMYPTTGNKLSYTGLGKTERINLGGSFNSGSLYFSLTLKITSLGILGDTNNQILFGFNTATGATTNNPTVINPSVWVTKGTTDTSKFRLGIAQNSAATSRVYDTTEYSVNTELFLVGSYTFVNGTLNDTAQLWIFNPATGVIEAPPLSPTVSATTGIVTDSGALQSFLLYSLPSGSTASTRIGSADIDELRIGTTWYDVVPEPSTLSMLVVAGVAMLPRRRRR